MNKVYEIKRLDFALCEHDPRAQSVCEPPKALTFNEFQKKITNFDSFYDYYELEDKIMFVFRVNSIYRRDIDLFKQNRFHDMSDDYKILFHRNIKFNDIDIDIRKEIYRFEEYLS